MMMMIFIIIYSYSYCYCFIIVIKVTHFNNTLSYGTCTLVFRVRGNKHIYKVIKIIIIIITITIICPVRFRHLRDLLGNNFNYYYCYYYCCCYGETRRGEEGLVSGRSFAAPCECGAEGGYWVLEKNQLNDACLDFTSLGACA